LSSQEPPHDYRSDDEFAAVMTGLARQLHSKNRIWLGESGYVWQVACLLQAIGEDFRDGMRDAGVQAQFGNGYVKATESASQQVDILLDRLKHRLLRTAP
jgi:hypothetical protein